MLAVSRYFSFFLFLFSAILGFAQSATIVVPRATVDSVNSPVRVVASFSPSAPIASISVLVDGADTGQIEPITPLDVYLPMSPGRHVLSVNAVQEDGLQLSTSRSIEVSSPTAVPGVNTSLNSTAPRVSVSTSGTVSSISDIEEKSGWYMYPDQGSPVCSSAPSLTSSPSLDGASGKFHLGPTGQFNNCLWPIKLGSNTTATNFTLDTHYQLNNPAVAQGVEFSSNKHMGTKWYKFSVQCSYHKGVFSVWDTAGSHWSATTIPCKRPAPNTWDHLAVQTQISNGKAVFLSLTLNGVTYPINKSFFPLTKASSYSFGVHFQMDGDRAGDPYTAWVDKLKFSLW